MCDACYGKCPICSPDVVIECEKCNGEGKVLVYLEDCDEWDYEICETCNGEGFINIEL
jgi:DnaJ-class molecular chaperone